MQRLISSITEEIKLNTKTPLSKLLFTQQTDGKNEFLVILKPELFAYTSQKQQADILKYIFKVFAEYHFEVENIRLLNAAFLKQNQIIDQHYGLINAAARDIHSHINIEAISNFEKIYKTSFETASVFGAIELLKHQLISEEELAELWRNCEIKRLASGIFCGKVNHQKSDLYIINGFHPPQIKHFITDNRITITMQASSNTNWEMARQQMIGNTYPEKANGNSIRGSLYKQYDNFGFNNVSYVLNGIHLSAGPLEGLLELIRFNTPHTDIMSAIGQFKFGQQLKENFSASQIELILSNPCVIFNNKATSLFDLTEEVNADDAIQRIALALKTNVNSI